MDRKERLEQLMKSGETDCILTGFWHHFPGTSRTGHEAVMAHVGFCDVLEPDILKVMNEHMFPKVKIDKPSDWALFEEIPFEKTGYQDYIEEFRCIRKELPADLPMIATVQGAFVSSYQAADSPGQFLNHDNFTSTLMRQDPKSYSKALV